MIEREGAETESFDPPPTKAPVRSAAEYMIHCLETGAPIEGFCSMEASRDAQEILEAGKRAADTGQTMNLPL